MPHKSIRPRMTIRIGSYNIMASGMADTDIIVAAIAAMNANIIGLQEVDNQTLRSGKNFSTNGCAPLNQAEYIAGKLGLNYCFCKAMDFDGGEYGTAILSRYPLKVHKSIQLPNTNRTEPRAACAVEIRLSDYPVVAVTTHLDHTSQQLRAEQVRALTSHFSTNEPLILIGDLNLTPDSDEYQHLIQYFCETDAKLTPTEPSWEPQNKIDYILLSKANTQAPFWDIQDFYIPKPEDKVRSVPYAEISDHLPITVLLSASMSPF